MSGWSRRTALILSAVAAAGCAASSPHDSAVTAPNAPPGDCYEIRTLMREPSGEELRWLPVELHVDPEASREQALQLEAWQARLQGVPLEGAWSREAIALVGAEVRALANAHRAYAQAVEQRDRTSFELARNELELRYEAAQEQTRATAESCGLGGHDEGGEIQAAFLSAAGAVCWCYSYVAESGSVLYGEVTADVRVSGGAVKRVRFVDSPPAPSPTQNAFLRVMLGAEPATRLPTLEHRGLLECLRETIEDIEFPSGWSDFTTRRTFRFGGPARRPVVDLWIDCPAGSQDDYRRDRQSEPHDFR